MDVIRYLISAILGLFGLWIILLNWYILCRYIRNNKPGSGFPFIGAILLCIAIAIFPNNPYPWLCWGAFLIDYGSLPGIIDKIIFMAKKRRKK